MSLMLPAVVSNNASDSNQSDTVAMMKIDCQVKLLKFVFLSSW